MKLRKILAAGLSMTLAVSMVVTGSVYAGEADTETVMEMETETADEAIINSDTEVPEGTEVSEEIETTEETEVTEGSEMPEVSEETENTKETETTEEMEEPEATEETEITEETETTEVTGETEMTEETEETEVTEATEKLEIVDEQILAKNSTVSVKDYGADGTDKKADTVAIQKALNAVKKAGGGTVTVPKGTYYIEQSLVIYSNTTLHLDDSATIKRSVYFSDKTYDETIGDYVYGPMVKNYAGTEDVLDGYGYDYSNDITIEGGTWNGDAGNAGGTASKPANIFQIYCATGVTIQKTKIKSVCGLHHIRLASVQDADIKNVVFSDFVYYKWADYDGLESGAEDDGELNAGASITSEALQLDNYSATNVCKNISVTGCTFRNVLSGVGNHRSKVGGNISKIGATDIKIANNKFQNVANTCMNLYDFEAVDVSGNTAESVRSFARVYKGKDCVISNNTVTTFTSGNQYDVFRISNGAKLSITGNTISGAGNTAIKVASKSTVDITANIFKGEISYNAVGVENSTANVCKNTFTEGSIGNIAIYFIGSKGTINTNTISTAKVRPIGVWNTSSVTQIVGNNVTGGRSQGIYVLNSSVGEINGNTVTSSGAEGIGISGGSASVGNIVLNKVNKAGAEGIRVEEGAVVTNIGGNSSAGNIVTASVGSGIYAGASQVTNISYNIVDTAGGTSIRVASAVSKANITNNTVSNGKEKGIYASGSEIVITSNKINKSASTAIHVDGGKGTVKKNTIKTTLAGDGILVSGGAKISRITKNKISSTKENGIEITGKSSVKYIGEKKDTGNTVEKAGTNGIYLKEGVSVSNVFYNTVKSSKSANISTEKTKGTLNIANNTLTSAKNQGIRVLNTKVKITDNKISKSVSYGIYLDGKNVNATVKNNTIDTVSKGNGIRVCNGKTTLTANNIKKTKTQGIYVVKGTVTIAGDNKVSNAGSKKALTIKGGTIYMTSGNAKMQLKSGKLVVCGTTTSSATKVTIPSKIKIGNVTYKVTEVGNKAFKNHKKIKTLTIGSNVAKIGKSAFEGCTALQTVTVNTTGLTEKNVGDYSFKGITDKCTFKVPSDKVTAYKNLFKGRGAAEGIKVVKK